MFTTTQKNDRFPPHESFNKHSIRNKPSTTEHFIPQSLKGDAEGYCTVPPTSAFNYRFDRIAVHPPSQSARAIPAHAVETTSAPLGHDRPHHRAGADGPASSSPPPLHPALTLQRTIGNQAVGRLFRSRSIQAKLQISQPDDLYEQEADRVADKIMAASAQSIARSAPPRIQRVVSPAQAKADAAPASVGQVLASPGAPLDPALRQDMEQRFGYDFSRVRVHTDAAAEQSALEVDAHAYTVGHQMVFGAGRFAPGMHEGRRLIAHELAHVVQQTSVNQSGLGPTRFLQRQPAAPNPRVRERVINRVNLGERSRTVVKIDVIGDASPRWRSAKTPQIADELNWRLSEKRAQAVCAETEKILNALIPIHMLLFECRFKPFSEMAEPVRALDEPADVSADFQGRGSTETLVEAGRRGRRANDAFMRRVEVGVTFYNQTDTFTGEEIELREHKSGATRDWGLWIADTIGLALGGSLKEITISLHNQKTGQDGMYVGWIGGVGVGKGGGKGLPTAFATTSLPQFKKFRTPKPMSFADFSGARFVLGTIRGGLGIGLQASEFRFVSFVGGQPTPGWIRLGGLSFGGIGASVNFSLGTVFLTNQPDEEYTKVTRVGRQLPPRESFASETTTHRVFFATGSDKVTALESNLLKEYLIAIVNRSGL